MRALKRAARSMTSGGCVGAQPHYRTLPGCRSSPTRIRRLVVALLEYAAPSSTSAQASAAHTLTEYTAARYIEALKGNPRGFHSIRINNQWCAVFRWTDSGPAEVDIRDYH